MLITSPLLRSRHAFFTRQGGVSKGLYASLNGGIGSKDDPGHVQENRARMAGELGVVPERLLSLYQIHSPHVVMVTKPWNMLERPQADAMVTREKGLALAIGTADCGPILFEDFAAGVIGAAHAGWKGALGGVLEATLAAMEALGAQRSHIRAMVGPTISGRVYQVGAEFRERFVAESAVYERFFEPDKDKLRFDLPSFILFRLHQAGIGEALSLNLCTLSDKLRFFSYRRATLNGEADYGRQISAIVL